MKTKLMHQLTNLPKWNNLAETLDFYYLSCPFYMVGVTWDALKSSNGINGMHFYNTREGFTNIDFLSVDKSTQACVVVSKHYNLKDEHVINHIESTLERTI